MSTSNELQIGGDHYKIEYEHWDFVTDLDLPYLVGCATKYLIRWRKKNGLEDLDKALHYIAKADERGLPSIAPRSRKEDILLERFAGQLPKAEGDVVRTIVLGQYGPAARRLRAVIAEETARLLAEEDRIDPVT